MNACENKDLLSLKISAIAALASQLNRTPIAIVQHLKDFKRSSGIEAHNHRRPWTAADQQEVLQRRMKGDTIIEIANALGRKPMGVRWVLYGLGKRDQKKGS